MQYLIIKITYIIINTLIIKKKTIIILTLNVLKI